MPWKETCAMDQRMQLIGDWLKGEFSITDLSESFGVSRPTVYKWIARYRERGVSGFGRDGQEASESPQCNVS